MLPRNRSAISTARAQPLLLLLRNPEGLRHRRILGLLPLIAD